MEEGKLSGSLRSDSFTGMRKVKERALESSVRGLLFAAGRRGSLLIRAEKLSVLATPALALRGSMLCSWGLFRHLAQSSGCRVLFRVP